MHSFYNSPSTRTQLTDEKVNQDMKINNLMAQDKQEGGPLEKDIKASPLFVEISSKLSAAEREARGLKNELQAVQDRWALSKGDLELVRKTIHDLEAKHSYRLRELSGGGDDGADASDSPFINGGKGHIEQAKLVMELEHKLKHALDNVRQSESVRISLADSHSMNAILQRQIGNLKANNEELASAQGEVGDNADLLEISPTKDGQSKDKLYRMKKELTAALGNKDEMRYKFEVSCMMRNEVVYRIGIGMIVRVGIACTVFSPSPLSLHELQQNEKERASLVSMNMRLQQQTVEKDDMNAKSLSTILHLKQLSEQLEQEKDILEKNLKSAQQLALAARLAANAKARVEEEAMREKDASQEEAKQLLSALESLQKEKEALEAELAVTQAQMESSKSDMGGIRKRCDELVAASVENDQEKRRLEEALVVAKKDAIDAVQKAATAQVQARGSAGSKFDSEFTAEELTIQVNQLKSRLACPVCNTRDKKVIITRCRHMFCRHCVATSLEGRNRKCPSCGLRFDKKDVEDVWF